MVLVSRADGSSQQNPIVFKVKLLHSALRSSLTVTVSFVPIVGVHVHVRTVEYGHCALYVRDIS